MPNSNLLYTTQQAVDLARLVRANNEYRLNCGYYTPEEFNLWLQEQYGAEYVPSNEAGSLFPTVDHQFIRVVDEQKYLLFLMRFAHVVG